MRKAPKAYIFDLDGTLLDTLPDMLRAFNLGLEAHGMPTHTEEAYRSFMDQGMKRIFTRAMPPDTPKDKMMEVVLTTRGFYEELWRKGTRPFPGVVPMLRAIEKARVPMTVLTNKPHPFAVEMVRHFFPDVPFTDIQGVSPDIPSKPDPTAARAQVDILGIAPEAIFFVGDSVEDVKTAQACGMPAVAVTWGFRPEKELREAGADIIIYDPSELIQDL